MGNLLSALFKRGKKILVTGGGGLLGRQLIPELVRRGYVVENISTRTWDEMAIDVRNSFKKHNVENHTLDLNEDLEKNQGKGLREIIEKGKFNFVVNLAADRGGIKYGNVTMKMDNDWLNAELPARLADLGAEFSVPILQVSTEYVWTGNGNDDTGYPPDEPCGVDSNDARFVGETGAAPYAVQKVKAEREMLSRMKVINGGFSVVILRVPVLYGPMLVNLEDGTASTSLNNFFGENNFKHDTWQRRYPTAADDVAFVIGALVSKRLSPQGLRSRVYHYGAQEVVSKYDFMKKCLKAFGLPATELNKLKTEDASQRQKPPPYDVRLNIDKTREELGKDWREPRPLSDETINRVWGKHFAHEIDAKKKELAGST